MTKKINGKCGYFQRNIWNPHYIKLPKESNYKRESKDVLKLQKKKKNNKNNAICKCPFGCSCWCNFLPKELVDSLSFYKPEDDDENIIQQQEQEKLPKVYKPYNFLFEKDERIYSLVDRKYSDEGKRNIKNNKKIIVNNTNTNTNTNTNNNNNSSRISTNYDDLQFDIGPITIGRKMF
jgi:hypothetical protein